MEPISYKKRSNLIQNKNIAANWDRTRDPMRHRPRSDCWG